MTTEFGKRMKLARARIDMTQEELADASGIKQSTVGSTEAHGLASQFTAEFAQALGVNAFWLATGKGDPDDGIVWPFKTVTRSFMKNLTPEQLEAIEKFLLTNTNSNSIRKKTTKPASSKTLSGIPIIESRYLSTDKQSVTETLTNTQLNTEKVVLEPTSLLPRLALSVEESKALSASQNRLLLQFFQARIEIDTNEAIIEAKLKAKALTHVTVPPRPKDADSRGSTQSKVNHGPTVFVSKQPRKKRS